MEVYPRLQERNFLQFLLNQNILVEDVKKCFVKRFLFFKELLLKNVESYKKNKIIDYLDIKDINGFLFRDLLFINHFSINDKENTCVGTIDPNFGEYYKDKKQYGPTIFANLITPQIFTVKKLIILELK